GTLGLVPVAVVGGGGMDVVSGLVLVHNAEGLIDHERDDMGLVLAAGLVEFDRRGGRGERAVLQAGLDVDDHVGQVAVLAGDDIFGEERRGSMRFGAVGVG